MRWLRRLSTISVTYLSAVLSLSPAGIYAQTAPTPFDLPAVSAAPAPLAAPILPPLSTSQSAPQLPGPSTTFRVPPLSAGEIHRLETLRAQQLPILALNEEPCYKLRTYGFTPGKDPAEAPHLSSQTTCAPASQSHVRLIVITPPGR